MALRVRLLRLFKWVKPNLIIFSVLQAREVYEDRVELLHQNGPLAPYTFKIRHVIRQAVARSDKSFERILRNLEFLQINAQRLLKFLDRGVELIDPSLFNLGALRNVRPHRGDGGIGSQYLVIVTHARCPPTDSQLVSLPQAAVQHSTVA